MKSPAAMAKGLLPAPVITVPEPVKVPAPVPSRIAMLSFPTLATARSAKVSPLN